MRMRVTGGQMFRGSRITQLLAGFVTSAVLLAPEVARSDVVPAEASGCRQKQPSESCTMTDGSRGTCERTERTQIVYGPQGPQGSVKETILVCKPSPPLLDRASPGALLAGGAGVVAIVGGAMLALWAWSRDRGTMQCSSPNAVLAKGGSAGPASTETSDGRTNG